MYQCRLSILNLVSDSFLIEVRETIFWQKLVYHPPALYRIVKRSSSIQIVDLNDKFIYIDYVAASCNGFRSSSLIAFLFPSLRFGLSLRFTWQSFRDEMESQTTISNRVSSLFKEAALWTSWLLTCKLSSNIHVNIDPHTPLHFTIYDCMPPITKLIFVAECHPTKINAFTIHVNAGDVNACVFAQKVSRSFQKVTFRTS